MNEDINLKLMDGESIIFDGPIHADINIYVGGKLCGEEIDCGEIMGGQVDEHEFEQSGGQCFYEHVFDEHHDQNDEHVDIAAENDWDMIGFITGYTHADPQDHRVEHEDFMTFVYDVVCCEDLVEAIETRMMDYDLDIYGIEEYNDMNYSEQVNDAYWDALHRCSAFHEYLEEDNFGTCDYWSIGNPEFKPQWQMDAEDMDWDAQLFMTDFILKSDTRPVSDPRINETLVMEVF